ncbi:MAG: 4Fe-4S binding protein, partial [Pseudomonadota bacterium]
MLVAVASGKGGTGKTTLATNLAVAMAEAGQEVAYLDCDVEEPDGHLFLQPRIDERSSVVMLVPTVDEDACTHCGKCAQVCQWGAIILMGEKVVAFPELCHGCGGCALICPASAIREVPCRLGVVEDGWADGIRFIQGRL